MTARLIIVSVVSSMQFSSVILLALVRGLTTILEAPESGSFIALVDVTAEDANAAVAKAWAAYKPDALWL